MGPMYLWILPFTAHAWYITIDGIGFITNPHSFGFANSIGWHFLGQALVVIISLILLLRFGPRHLKLRTQDNVYILRFYSINKRKKTLQKALCNLFNVNDNDIGKNHTPIQKSDMEKSIFKIIWDFFLRIDLRLRIGLLFIAIAIMSRGYKIFAGEPLAVWLFITGIILIFKGMNENPQSKHLLQKNAEGIMKKPDIFDLFTIGIIGFHTILTNIYVFWFIPSIIDSYWIFVISNIIGSLIIFYCLFRLFKFYNWSKLVHGLN